LAEIKTNSLHNQHLLLFNNEQQYYYFNKYPTIRHSQEVLDLVPSVA
jgi:hypothetical protein